MQTKFEYSAGGTNNAAKILHQMSLFIKQHENTSTSEAMTQKSTATQRYSTLPTKTKDKPKQIRKGFGTNIVILPKPK
jgi:hypothetical protein